MTLSTFIDTAFGVLLSDFLRYAFFAGGVFAVINVVFAHLLARRKIRPDRPGWDQIRSEILTSLRTVLIFAATGTMIGVGAHLGVLPIYSDIQSFGWLWLMASIILIILAHDAWFYWSHWLLHRVPGLRRFHRAHHLSHNPTPFTSYRFDPEEAVVHAIFLPVFLALVPMHPTAILVFVSHMMLRNTLGHCGYELFPARRDGRPLVGWLTTVTHHDLHHANARYNFGLYFAWWDRWMGTEHPRYRDDYAEKAPRLPKSIVAILTLGLVCAACAPIQTNPSNTAQIFTPPNPPLIHGY